MKLKILYFVILIISTSLISQENDQYRLSHKVEPVYQFIQLNLDPDEDEYSGSTKIELQIKQEISTFRLHAKDFAIEQIELISGTKSISVNFSFEEYGFLKIIPDIELDTGIYSLSFTFIGQFNKKGEGIVKFTKDSLNYIFTQMEPIYARQFFPCFDEPNFKFPYQIEITAPKEYLAVSNTEIEEEYIKGANKTVLFKKTKPMPVYLLAFAVGPYETTPIPGLSIPGRIILPKGYVKNSRYIKNNTAKILNALENYFGSHYPYEKLDFIGVGAYSGAMENPGLIVFAERSLIDSKNLSINNKRSRVNLTAHELAHMWFGNLVTLKWWNDTWLNEGFATWMAAEIVLQEFPELKPKETFVSSFNWALNKDVKATTEPVYRDFKGNDNPLDAFDALSYGKCQVVIRMVENWVGRDAFRQGMKNYFEKYKWKNSKAEDLFNVLKETSGKDVIQVMRDFIFQAGIPVVEAEIKNTNTVGLKQYRYKSIENENHYQTTWHIPISLKIYDGKNVYVKSIYLTKEKQEYTFQDIEDIKWIQLKNKLLGYFIQVLPAKMLKDAIESTQLDIYEKKDLLTGLKFSYLAGKTSPTSILEFAAKMKNTSDEAIIEALSSRIRSIYSVFGKNINKHDYLFYSKRVAYPMLEKIGYEFSLDESNAKSNARYYLSYVLIDDEEVRNNIFKQAKRYLNNAAPFSWKHYNYLVYLIYYKGTSDLHKTLIQRFENTKDPIERSVILWAIGYFSESSLVKRNLEYILNENFQGEEYLKPLISIQRMYKRELDSRGNILPWLKEHYSLFKEHVSQNGLDYWLPMFIIDLDDLASFNELFPKSERSKYLEKEVMSKVEGLYRNKKLRELYSNEVKEYLKDFKKR